MKLSISKSDLQNAISTVIKAVPSKSNLSNADCILVEARMDELRLVANNSEMAIESIYPARVLEEGKICLESKQFLEIVRELPDGDIHIESDKSFVTNITCAKSFFQIFIFNFYFTDGNSLAVQGNNP